MASGFEKLVVDSIVPTNAQPLFNGHSMVGALKRVLVCSPRTACWHQPERAARWRELGFIHPPDFELAQAQHDALCRELEACGAEVEDIPPAMELSLDAVYAHDASLPTDFGLILMRPGKANRVPEGRHHGSFCQIMGVPMLAVADGPTEVHLVQVANALLKNAKPAPGLFPSEHIPTKRAAARARFGDP